MQYALIKCSLFGTYAKGVLHRLCYGVMRQSHVTGRLGICQCKDWFNRTREWIGGAGFEGHQDAVARMEGEGILHPRDQTHRYDVWLSSPETSVSVEGRR